MVWDGWRRQLEYLTSRSICLAVFCTWQEALIATLIHSTIRKMFQAPEGGTLKLPYPSTSFAIWRPMMCDSHFGLLCIFEWHNFHLLSWHVQHVANHQPALVESHISVPCTTSQFDPRSRPASPDDPRSASPLHPPSPLLRRWSSEPRHIQRRIPLQEERPRRGSDEILHGIADCEE